MTQDERWNIRYQEVLRFIETNKRNPSKYALEERNMYNYIKHTRKQMNQGLLKPERIPIGAVAKTEWVHALAGGLSVWGAGGSDGRSGHLCRKRGF